MAGSCTAASPDFTSEKMAATIPQLPSSPQLPTSEDADRASAPHSATRHYMGLCFVLAEREFVAGFRGNWTGALTTFAVPLFMLATYSFVFSTLIPVRIRPEQTQLDYAFFLFSGLIVWNGVVDVATRAPRIFAESRHYVQRPQFPLSLLVVAPCLAGLYRALPWVAAYLLAHRALPSQRWRVCPNRLWQMLLRKLQKALPQAEKQTQW